MVFPTADAAAQFVLEFRTRKLDQFKGDMGQSRVRSRIVAHYGSFTRGDLDVLAIAEALEDPQRLLLDV